MKKKKASKKTDPNKKYAPSVLELFPAEASKSQIQRVRIVEAAIESFAVEGIEKTTYSNLAKKCGISRTLIHHYFPTVESLFLLAARYVRQTLLRLALQGMEGTGDDPRAQLEGYVRGCFKWVELFPQQTSFWMLFFYQSSMQGQARNENSELVANGQKRIESMLSKGKELGYWQFTDGKAAAKMVQLFLTGGIVSCITEDGYLSVTNAPQLTVNGIRALLEPRS